MTFHSLQRTEKSGVFITFEGGEGAGKSTQVRLLKDALEASGASVILTREPGGSEGAEEIRNLFVNGEPGRWDAMTEALLILAARRDHLRRVVIPALNEGKWVICDRFSDSTMAYQGYAHGLGRDVITQLSQKAIDGFAPDMTFILDLPVAEGLARAKGRGEGEDRFERMELDFHQRLRDAFLDIAKREPERCYVLDSTKLRKDVHAKIVGIVAEKWTDQGVAPVDV